MYIYVKGKMADRQSEGFTGRRMLTIFLKLRQFSDQQPSDPASFSAKMNAFVMELAALSACVAGGRARLGASGQNRSELEALDGRLPSLTLPLGQAGRRRPSAVLAAVAIALEIVVHGSAGPGPEMRERDSFLHVPAAMTSFLKIPLVFLASSVDGGVGVRMEDDEFDRQITPDCDQRPR